MEAGYAIALVPDFPKVRLPQLRYIPLADAKPLSFGAACLPGKGNPALGHFLDLLSRSLQDGAGNSRGADGSPQAAGHREER